MVGETSAGFDPGRKGTWLIVGQCSGSNARVVGRMSPAESSAAMLLQQPAQHAMREEASLRLRTHNSVLLQSGEFDLNCCNLRTST